MRWDRPQGVGGPGDGGVVHALLEGCDIAAVQRQPEVVGEDRQMVEAFGRNELERIPIRWTIA